MLKHWVHFPESSFSPQALPEGAALAEHLTVENSPILFGCRTGICGTCLVRVTPETLDHVDPADCAEQEVLAMLAPAEPCARLACQLKIAGDLSLTPLEEEG
jgi:ferredoxin